MPYASPRVVFKFVNIWRPLTLFSHVHPTIPKISCMHLYHLQMFYHVSMQHASVHFWITHTSCKIFTKPSKYTTHHLGIYSTLYSHHPKIPKHLYCKRSYTGTYSSIHLLPSIQPFCSQPLMFSINFRSIAKDGYSPPPFSEMNRCLIFF